jgi:zeaxanthin glucosyltransferase
VTDILWVALDDPGHIFALNKPARDLAARGHEITFATFGEPAATVFEGRGFKTYRLFEREMATPEARKAWVSSWLRRPINKDFRRERDRVITCLADEVEKIADIVKPELVIIDSILSPAHLHIADRGRRVALASCAFLQPRYGTIVPPYTTDVVPGEPFWRARSAYKWLSHWWRYDVVRSYDMPNTYRVIRPLRRRRIDPRDGFAELFFSCHEFDFPQTKHAPYTIDVGPVVDLDRPIDPTFPWDRIDPNKPLVYAALGTLGHFWAEEEARMWRTILEAVTPRTDWQVVLAGKGLKAISAELAAAPSHVIAVDHAPQIELLRRASVMIHHAGFNSVKECILLGVPMVALPPASFADQPGVAARVAFHGLGRKGSMHGVTAAELRAMVDDVLVDPGYRERIEKMKVIFERADAENRIERAIERIVAGEIGSGQPALDAWRKTK